VTVWAYIESFTSVICASIIAARPIIIKVIPKFLLPKNKKETLPLPSTSKRSKRSSKQSEQQMNASKRSSTDSKILESTTHTTCAESKEEVPVKVWITNDTSVETRSLQMDDLTHDVNDLAPGFKGRTTVEGKPLPAVPPHALVRIGRSMSQSFLKDEGTT
jgi:hypothetical protein